MTPETGSVWNVDHLRLAIDAAGVALWSWNVDTDWLRMDETGCRLWGVDDTKEVMFEDLSAHIHPGRSRPGAHCFCGDAGHRRVI